MPVRINATLEDLDAGRPLGFSGCEPLALPAGPARLSVEPGAAHAVPAAPALAGLLPARSGAAGRRRLAGNRDPRRARRACRLALDAPGRLVLAESFNRGRRASCDGRDLGEPSVGDAFGTAWNVPADLPRRSRSPSPRTGW